MSESVATSALDELWAALSDGDGAAPSPALLTRITRDALDRRTAGRPVDAAPAITPVEALTLQVEAFDSLLASLSAADWARPALRGLDVQGLVGHLIGVETDFQSALGAAGLGGSPPPGWRGDAEHVASTQPFALSQAARAPEATHHDWREAAAGSVERVSALSSASTAVLTLHGVPLPLDAWLVVRTFELWTHEEDVRRATDRPLAPPASSAVRLMCDLATGLLPSGVDRSGVPGPGGVVRIVLTGPGGGAWTVRLPSAAAEPARVRIVADAVAFCRLVAARVQPADVGAAIEGDAGLAARVLSGSRALALD